MPGRGVPMVAEGRTPVRAAPEAVRRAVLDPDFLLRIIPGAETVTRAPDGTFTARLGLGVGPFRGHQTVTLRVEREDPPHGLAVAGRATGPFGSGEATGRIDLLPDGHGGTAVAWRYDGAVSAPVALAGPRLLRLAATAFTGRVFAALARLLPRGTA